MRVFPSTEELAYLRSIGAPDGSTTTASRPMPVGGGTPVHPPSITVTGTATSSQPAAACLPLSGGSALGGSVCTPRAAGGVVRGRPVASHRPARLLALASALLIGGTAMAMAAFAARSIADRPAVTSIPRRAGSVYERVSFAGNSATDAESRAPSRPARGSGAGPGRATANALCSQPDHGIHHCVQRTGPGFEFTTVAGCRIRPGDEVHLLSRAGNGWWHVVGCHGTPAFMHGDVLER